MAFAGNNSVMQVGEETTGLSSGLGNLVSLIPNFDGESNSITPELFIGRYREISALAKWNEKEKLIVLKSKLRGNALTILTAGNDMGCETNAEKFVTKFLEFFQVHTGGPENITRLLNCRQQISQGVREFAIQVRSAAHSLYGTSSDEQEEANKFINKIRHDVFINGLLPKIKQAVWDRDTTDFEMAYQVALRVEQNLKLTSVNDATASVQALKIDDQASDNLIKSLIRQAEEDRQTIQRLQGQSQGNQDFYPNRQRSSRGRDFHTEGRIFTNGQRNGNCFRCGGNNHWVAQCTYPPIPRFQQARWVVPRRQQNFENNPQRNTPQGRGINFTQQYAPFYPPGDRRLTGGNQRDRADDRPQRRGQDYQNTQHDNGQRPKWWEQHRTGNGGRGGNANGQDF